MVNNRDGHEPDEQQPEYLRHAESQYSEPRYPEQQYPEQRHYSEQQYPEPYYSEQQNSEPHYPEQQYSNQQYPEQQNSEPQYPEQQYSNQQYPEQQYPDQQYSNQQYPNQQYLGQQYPEQQYSNQQYLGQQYSGQQHPVQQHPEQQYPGQQPAEPWATSESSSTLESAALESAALESSALDSLGFEDAKENEQAEDTASKRRGIIWLIVGLAAILVVAIIAWFVFFNNANQAADDVVNFQGQQADGQRRGPESTESGGITVPLVDDPTETVREYLTLLAEGDHAGAGAFVDPGAPLASGDALAVDALAGAQSRISVISVELVDESEGSASVRATMSLEGAQFEHVFALTLSEVTVDGTSERVWNIGEPLVSAVEVSASGLDSVSIGGISVGLEAEDTSQRIYLYPGVYTISGDAGDYFSVSGGDQQVRVTTPSATTEAVYFSAAPNDAFGAEVLAQVQDRVDLCTQVPGNMDEECPSITRNTKLEELTVTQFPSGLASVTSTSFVSTRAEIGVVDSPTSANPEPSQRTSEFNVYGDISIVDGYPQVTNIRSY